jgi:hypothetical protein
MYHQVYPDMAVLTEPLRLRFQVEEETQEEENTSGES